jgi:hypothetical protein
MATDVADLLLKIDATTEGLRRELKKAETAVDGGRKAIDSNTKKIDQSFTTMGANVKKVVGVIAVAMGGMAIGRKFADTVVETEKLRASLTTMTGSAELAGKAFDELTEFAAKTPFTLDKSVNAFIKLKAMGLDPSERAMMSYGNTASAMGKDMSQMIEAVADAATGEFERLKEFGIRAKSQGDNVSLTFQGVTTTIGKNSEEIQGYLLGIGEVQFAGAMEDQMERLPGLLSNLQDNVDGLFRKMGDAGGINIFGAGITAASSLVLTFTDNLDIVGTGIAAVGAALSVMIAPSVLVGGFALVTKAVLAMNAAFLANPIGLIVAAMAAAAVVIYRNWDDIKIAAEKAALNIEIAWNKLKIYLLESFAPALDTISGLFTGVQDNAVATWTAIAAAAKDPLSAIETFNTTFDTTLQRLKDGREGSGSFGDSVVATKDRIGVLEGKLAAMNTTVADVDETVGDADFSLSQFKTEVDETATATADLDKKGRDLVGTLGDELSAFDLSNVELAIRNNLQAAGVTASSELGQEIIALTTQINNEKQALTDAATEAKALEKANDESARAAEEAWGRTNDYLATTFVDIMNNGKGAFSQIAEAFTGMIKRMIAEWAASKLMNLMGFGGTASSGAGNPISTILSGGASAIFGGGTAAATTTAAAAGGTSILAGAGSAITGAASTVVGGVASAGSAALGALSAIPGWGWALGGAALLANVLDDSGTMSSNAGMLTQDLGHAGSFGIDPFASGAQFTGFARRSDQQGATDNIDAFRAVDSYLTNVFGQTIGGAPNLNASDFIGYDEKGSGRGAFFGSASEEGGSDGTPMAAQLDKFAARWVTLAGQQNGVDQATINAIIGSGGVEAILANAGGLVPTDGSHFNGLRRVPFDGYRAELHKNEEVLRANDPRNSNNGAGESAGMLNEMRKIAQSVKTTADLLTRVTRDGNSLVTEPA